MWTLEASDCLGRQAFLALLGQEALVWPHPQLDHLGSPPGGKLHIAVGSQVETRQGFPSQGQMQDPLIMALQWVLPARPPRGAL